MIVSLWPQANKQPIYGPRTRALFAALVLVLAACAPQAGQSGQSTVIPPIDLAAPKRLETATFALG